MTDTQQVTLASWLLACIAADEAAAATVRIEAPPFTNPDGSWQTVPGRPKEADQRTLAVCKAHRAIVELHRERMFSRDSTLDADHTAFLIERYGDVEYPGTCMTCGVEGEYPVPLPCPTLRALAQPYVDHPDFREEWGA